MRLKTRRPKPAKGHIFGCSLVWYRLGIQTEPSPAFFSTIRFYNHTMLTNLASVY